MRRKKKADRDQLRQGEKDIREVTHFLFCIWLFVVRTFRSSLDTSCGSVGEAYLLFRWDLSELTIIMGTTSLASAVLSAEGVLI